MTKMPSENLVSTRSLSISVGFLSLLGLEFVGFVVMPSVFKYKFYRLQFVIVLNCVLLIGSRFFWLHLVFNVLKKSTPGLVKVLWKCSVLVFLAFAHLASFTNYFISRDPTFIGMASWTCFGAFIILFSILAPLTMISDALNHISPVKILTARRQAFAAVLITALCTYTGYNAALAEPQIISVDIPIAKLPSDQVKIAMICDIHLGPSAGYTLLNRVVQITKNIDADILILAGDLTDATVAEMGEAASTLKQLRAKHGKYFVTGNHEYYTGDVENWLQLLQEYGFHILHNSNKKIYTGPDEDSWFCLLGTDDIQANQIRYEGHGMDLDKAYAGCDSSHAAILVAHQPKAAVAAADSKYDIQLVLSGHTHGGQMYPIVWLARLGSSYIEGLHKRANTHIYVSQGSVYYGFPIRLGSFPEITNITLRRQT